MRIRRRRLRRGGSASMAELTTGGGRGIAVEVDPDGFAGLTLQRDLSAVSWVADSLWDPSAFGTVAALIPRVFPAYARVDYPPWGPQSPARHALLFDVLTGHTQTPDHAWFCLWEGYGGLGPIPSGVRVASLPPEEPIRSYLLYYGTLSAWDAMTAFPFLHVPDLVWPDDRAWFLGTDTDLEWGFVGGSEGCIAALEREPALAVERVEPGDRLVP